MNNDNKIEYSNDSLFCHWLLVITISILLRGKQETSDLRDKLNLGLKSHIDQLLCQSNFNSRTHITIKYCRKLQKYCQLLSMQLHWSQLDVTVFIHPTPRLLGIFPARQ